MPREEPGGSLLIGQVGVRHGWWRERVWALVWNSGTCRPMGRSARSGSGLRLVVWSENLQQQICEGVVVDAGHRAT